MQQRLTLQESERLDVPCLREHIDGVDRYQCKSALAESVKVASHSERVARNHHYATGRERYECFQSLRVATDPRWIDDGNVDGLSGCGEIDSSDFGLCFDECHIFDIGAVDFRVFNG